MSKKQVMEQIKKQLEQMNKELGSSLKDTGLILACLREMEEDYRKREFIKAERQKNLSLFEKCSTWFWNIK